MNLTNKNKGFLGDNLQKALERSGNLASHKDFDSFATAQDFKKIVGNEGENTYEEEFWPRLPGSSDTGDPYGYKIKPEVNSKWTRPPSSDEEKALYYGVHIHTESNPLGLHTHNPGGKLSGGHSHGPQNRFGVHHHKDEEILHGISLDGKHIHEGKHYPDGKHEHCPENFG